MQRCKISRQKRNNSDVCVIRVSVVTRASYLDYQVFECGNPIILCYNMIYIHIIKKNEVLKIIVYPYSKRQFCKMTSTAVKSVQFWHAIKVTPTEYPIQMNVFFCWYILEIAFFESHYNTLL